MSSKKQTKMPYRPLQSGSGVFLNLLCYSFCFLLVGGIRGAAQQAPLPEAPTPQPSVPQKVVTAPVEAVQAAGEHLRFTSDKLKRFLNQKDAGPLSPPDKARLAVRDVLDPFNGATILFDAGIAVGANANSVYGPGMKGFGKYVGVSYTQDISTEFFATFLVPSLLHQDPRYFRRPQAPVRERIVHSLTHVVWSQGDDGHGMLNYGALVGGAASLAVSNLYVPGQQTNLAASVQRYGIAMATAPIDNVISEFLPDVAGHVHVQVVVIQRILNRIAQSGTAPGQTVP